MKKKRRESQSAHQQLWYFVRGFITSVSSNRPRKQSQIKLGTPHHTRTTLFFSQTFMTGTRVIGQSLQQLFHFFSLRAPPVSSLQLHQWRQYSTRCRLLAYRTSTPTEFGLSPPSRRFRFRLPVSPLAITLCLVAEKFKFPIYSVRIAFLSFSSIAPNLI